MPVGCLLFLMFLAAFSATAVTNRLLSSFRSGQRCRAAVLRALPPGLGSGISLRILHSRMAHALSRCLEIGRETPVIISHDYRVRGLIN